MVSVLPMSVYYYCHRMNTREHNSRLCLRNNSSNSVMPFISILGQFICSQGNISTYNPQYISQVYHHIWYHTEICTDTHTCIITHMRAQPSTNNTLHKVLTVNVLYLWTVPLQRILNVML